ncbi:ADP-ribosylglycohydrolase family protein [Dactylosporangium sp. CA-152071]|uniref:ADP-ribosylglycohydrolase family protein n=1 Tax=Dactylosporangium sp. CA-152071 TaxID=3239933 RepID=UPI003D8F0F23
MAGGLLGVHADTNAAIAGGLLGVRDGASAIPAEWLALPQYADEFGTAADSLCGR